MFTIKSFFEVPYTNHKIIHVEQENIIKVISPTQLRYLDAMFENEIDLLIVSHADRLPAEIVLFS